MSDTVDAISYKADVPHRMQDAIGDRVDSVRSAITGSVSGVRDRVTNAMPDPQDVQQSVRGMVDNVRENPLGLFFGAAAIGFLVGSLLPSTDIENERLAPIGDQLKSQARDAGEQLIERGKNVICETVESTLSAVQTGSSGGGLPDIDATA